MPPRIGPGVVEPDAGAAFDDPAEVRAVPRREGHGAGLEPVVADACLHHEALGVLVVAEQDTPGVERHPLGQAVEQRVEDLGQVERLEDGDRGHAGRVGELLLLRELAVEPGRLPLELADALLRGAQRLSLVHRTSARSLRQLVAGAERGLPVGPCPTPT